MKREKEIVQFSDREIDVLQSMVKGLTNQQIANDLGISVHTVKAHVRNIFSKTGAASRTEATLYAVRNRIVSVNPGEEPESFFAPDALVVQKAEIVTSDLEENPPTPLLLPEIAPLPENPMPKKPTSNLPMLKFLVQNGLNIGILLVGLILFGLIFLRSPQSSGTNQPTPGTQSVVLSQLSPNWTPRAALPVTQTAAAAASLNGSIFLIGGYNAAGVTGAVWRYDPDSDTWRSLSAKPNPVRDAQAVALNGKIYLPGGKKADGTISNLLEVYDPTSQAWTAAKPLPSPRSAYSLAALEGRMYLFGGTDGTQTLADVFAYDPQTDSWQTQTAMPTPRAYGGAVVLDGKIYLIGGENGGTSLAVNEEYVPANEGKQPWTPRAPLPKAQSHFGLGATSKFICLLGGKPEKTIMFYDIRTDTWNISSSSKMNFGIQPSVVERDSSLFVLDTNTDRSTSDLIELRLLYSLTMPIR